MPELVFVNGEFVPVKDAKISVFDHGFLYGDGIFETMRSYNSKIFLLDEHLERLARAAEALQLTLPYSKRELEALLEQTVYRNGPDLYIRLTVSRGPGPMGIDPGLCSKPTVVITTKEIKYNDTFYTQGVKAVFVSTMRNLAGATMPEVKSLNFLNNILAKQEVLKAGASEGFMLNHLGQVTEGTVSNVFLVKGDCLKTPSPESGLLEGITRQKVMELALIMGLEVKEEFLFKDDFAIADEVFYTNSGSEVVPVTDLDGSKVGTGKVGPVAQELLARYRSLAWGSPRISEG